MSNNLNIQKMVSNLTPKERAKMVFMDIDQKLMIGKGTLTKEEINSLIDFTTPKEHYEYSFYWNVGMLGATLISLSIECASLKFELCFQLLLNSEDLFKNVNPKEICQAMQKHLNYAYSFWELDKSISKEFDFPVMGEYFTKKAKDDLGNIKLLKNVVNKAISLKFRNNKTDLIKEPEIDNEIIETFLNTLKKNAPK